MKRSWLLLFFVWCLNGINAQVIGKPAYSNPKYKFKLSLLDQTVLSLPNIRVHADYLLLDDELPVYLSADAGYNFYSVDELVPSSGFIAGLRLNSVQFTDGRTSRGISPGMHVQQVYIHDFLKVEKQGPGTSTYFEYERLNYKKLRLGFNVDVYRQNRLFGPLFIETAIGLGIIYMKTIVPERVVQSSYTNGLSFRKETLLPNLTFSIKLGYDLFL